MYIHDVDLEATYTATMQDGGTFKGNAEAFAQRFQTSVYSAALWAMGRDILRKHGIRKVVQDG